MQFPFLSFAQMTISLGNDVRSWHDLFHPLISQLEEDVKEPTRLFKKFRGSFPCDMVYLISLHTSDSNHGLGGLQYTQKWIELRIHADWFA